MANILNLEKLLSTLRSKAAASIKDDSASVIVGYTQNYAIYVHENLEAKHKVGQAKFLEQPARETDGRITREALQRGKTLAQALLLEGLNLQRRSQKLVPVDTSTLKNSAFTRIEQGTGETA